VQRQMVDFPGISYAEMHRRVKRRFVKRRISEHGIRNMMKRLPPIGDRFVPTLWRSFTAWDESPGAPSPAQVHYVRRLYVVSEAVLGRPIQEHEAVWAMRLQPVIEGLDLFLQWLLVREYAYREEISTPLPERIDTSDLDALLAVRPWLPENQAVYASMWEHECVQDLIFECATTWVFDLPGFTGWIYRSLGYPYEAALKRIDWRTEGSDVWNDPPEPLPLEDSHPTETPIDYHWGSIVELGVERWAAAKHDALFRDIVRITGTVEVPATRIESG